MEQPKTGQKALGVRWFNIAAYVLMGLALWIFTSVAPNPAQTPAWLLSWVAWVLVAVVNVAAFVGFFAGEKLFVAANLLMGGTLLAVLLMDGKTPPAFPFFIFIPFLGG